MTITTRSPRPGWSRRRGQLWQADGRDAVGVAAWARHSDGEPAWQGGGDEDSPKTAGGGGGFSSRDDGGSTMLRWPGRQLPAQESRRVRLRTRRRSRRKNKGGEEAARRRHLSREQERREALRGREKWRRREGGHSYRRWGRGGLEAGNRHWRQQRHTVGAGGGQQPAAMGCAAARSEQGHGEPDEWARGRKNLFKTSNWSYIDLVHKLCSQAPKFEMKIWGDRIWKGEQLLPLELLQIRDENWIKIFRSQCSFWLWQIK
jgi:hypothetical protein